MPHLHAAITDTPCRRIAAAIGMVAMTLCLMLTACVRDEEMDDTPSGNLETLWRIIDEHYCFLTYKHDAYGLDWDSVHAVYSARLNPSMSRTQLFEVLCEMLGELRDGHVNLYATHDVGRYWHWYEDFPPNLYEDLRDEYLGTDYLIASALRYRFLPDNVGYMVCSSFATGLGSGNISEALNYLRTANGLIVDVRGNGGGDLTNAELLASHFTNERRHVGYIQHKTGPAHDAFSEPVAEYLEPARGVRWQKPVVVLTNRECYSATNTFVRDMMAIPGVVVVGDQTGGGAGLPFSSELPCGWSVRFSACPMLDADRRHTEHGIAPHVRVGITADDRARHRDTIIETARAIINSSL